MTLEIQLRCFPFLLILIILQMFLHLDWSPSVVNAIDWTRFGKAHTPVRSHSWQRISEQKPSREVEGTACRAQAQDCVEAQIWGRLQKNAAALKVPKSTVASIILKWKKVGTTRTLPRAGHPAKLGNWGRRTWVRGVTKNPMVTLVELQRSCVEMGETSRRTTIAATLHRCGPCAHPLPNTIPTVKHGGGSIMLWGCLGGLVRVEGRLNGAQVQDILNENLVQVQSAQDLRLGQRFTFQQDNDPREHSQDNAGVANAQLCEYPWVAQAEPWLEPN